MTPMKRQEVEMSDGDLVAKWMLSGGSGMSAKAIAAALLGMPCDGSYPHDGGDFGRCEELLDAVPTFRLRLAEMAAVNAYWAALVPEWDRIKTTPPGGQYALIQKILRPIEDADARVIRVGDGMTIRFGRSPTP